MSREEAASISGLIIRNCRKTCNLTMRELEALSGVTATQINNIEKGKNDPHIGTFLKLLDAMGYDFFVCPAVDDEAGKIEVKI